MKKFALIIALLVSQTVYSETYQVPLSDQPLKIDGVLDDEIWNQAKTVSLNYEIDPGKNIDPGIKTTAYVVDRGQSIAFAFVAEDPQPEKIRAFLRDRDSAYSDDFVGVMLDTYNDNRRALEFFVNPLGVQMDLIRDESRGSNEDDSWDAIWDSAGQITENGFVVEMEIPYNELQMPNLDGEKTWGIVFFRSHPREVRKQIQNTPNDRNNTCYLCQIDKFTGFANAERGRDLEITPSLTMIAQQNRDSLESDYSSVETDFEPSLDINWGISSNLTLNATFNPDFSQVEADAAQLDVNQTFALFFPEKRPFFLENADFFNSRINLIHTRNITSPDYGVRLVGKSDANAYGFFYANDTFTNILIPGVFRSGVASYESESDNFAARYRRDFGNSSTAGALLTHRSSGDYSSTVASLDSFYRLTDEKSVTVQYAQSDTTNSQALMEDFGQEEETSGDAYYLQFRHAGEKVFYYLSHTSYDDGFRADLGFIGRVGYQKTVAGAQYTWRPESKKWWNRFSVYADWDITHDQTGRMLEKELETRISLNATKQSFFGLAGLRRVQYWDGMLFDEDNLGFDFSFRPSANLSLSVGASTGDSIDFANSKLADRIGAYSGIGLNLGRHFGLNINHSFRKLSRDGGNVFTANQTDLRLTYQFNIRQRLKVSLINTNINRDVSLYTKPVDSHRRSLSSQVLYSYKVNPKTLLFVGYTDSGLEDENIDLTRTNRAVFAKFSYAFKR